MDSRPGTRPDVEIYEKDKGEAMKQILDLDVRYICDRRKCVNCYPKCKHTDDILHAANFEIIGGDMWEKETELATLEQASDDDIQ